MLRITILILKKAILIIKQWVLEKLLIIMRN